jgi:CHAT domain-containing protein
VVVLFVCSAGRADQSPEGESTYGLARELLGQGCSAVVASPWPLDSRVPYHWFPTFMEAWSSGKSVAAATFLANQHVANYFSSNLANCLAMTVFGDGLRMWMR